VLRYNPLQIIVDCSEEVILLEINYNEIGERIHSRRKELGFTQERLSDLTGLSANQISNLENGYSVPTIDTMLRLCNALKATPDYFLLGIAKEINSISINRIAEASLLSTDKQQNLIYEFINLLQKGDY
jgi:transcriptional regulator with XRE-family HTH domain